MSLAPPAADFEVELLDLAIRFSASLPDLLLSVPSPSASTTCTLKQLIRTHLPAELSNRRIRLIHAGKALVDTTPLATSLKLSTSRSPSRPSTPLPDHGFRSSSTSGSGKGKLPVRNPPSASRIYIHCSIGDVILTASDLAEEARLASPKPVKPYGSTTTESASPDNVPLNNVTTTPAPRGFDRLLAAGFSLSEVQSLRSQFLAIQAHTHTTADMPSPSALRELEDQWLDNSNAGRDPGTNGELGGGGFTDDEGQVGALDDLMYGVIMGFFWPVGCLWWICREDGVLTRRRKIAVVLGSVVNFAFGVIRWLR